MWTKKNIKKIFDKNAEQERQNWKKIARGKKMPTVRTSGSEKVDEMMREKEKEGNTRAKLDAIVTRIVTYKI